MNIVPTQYYPVFLEYARKAKIFQEECNLGGKSYRDLTVLEKANDELISNIHIYDTVERKHAGFGNVLMELWHGPKAPKSYKWTSDHMKRVVDGYANTRQWELEDWLYVFLVHRCTGSGASFEADHGYRNNKVKDFNQFTSHCDMSDFIVDHPEAIFTSIGNQPPSFKNGGRHFFANDAFDLVLELSHFIQTRPIAEQVPDRTIRDVVDFMNSFNQKRGFKRFNFVYTAVAMDIADFFPQYVSPASVCYYGSNAEKCLSLLFDKTGKMKTMDYYDAISQRIMEDIGAYPMDSEDIACDFVRYLNNYVPTSKMGTYDHLVGKVKNSTGIDPATLPESFRKYGN